MNADTSIRRNKGFTLVELMVAAVVSVIVIGGVYGLFITMKKANVTNKSNMEMQQNVRTALAQTTRLLTMAGYQGMFNYTGVAHGIVYSDDSGNAVTKSNSICFTFYDEDPAFKPQSPFTGPQARERRLTIYQSGSQILSKMECFDSSIRQFHSITTKPVIVADNIKDLSYKYYDADSAAIIPDADNVTTIRKVTVTITGQTGVADLILGGFRSFSLSTDIKPVNLGIEGHAADTTPPEAPTGLHVTDPHECVELNVTWNANKEVDIAGYKLYWGTSADDPDPLSKDVGNVTSYQLSDKLLKNSTYYVAISAYDTSGNPSAMSPQVFTGDAGSDDTTPNPDKPSMGAKNLKAHAGPGNGQITLTWDTHPDADVHNYRIFRKLITDPTHVTDFPGYPIKSTDLGVTEILNVNDDDFKANPKVTYDGSHYSYTDSGLIGCVMYDYAVAPINCDPSLEGSYTVAQYGRVYGNGTDVGNPASSDAKTVPPDDHPPLKPSGLSAVPGATSVYLSWTNPNDVDFAGIIVRRSTSTFPASPTEGDPVTLDSSITFKPGDSETSEDKNLAQTTCYFYTAFAYDKCFNNSSGIKASNILGGTEPACSHPCGDGILDTPEYGNPPAPPKDQYSASYCTHKVNIGWQDPPNLATIKDVIGYNIYRSDYNTGPIKKDFKGVGSFNVYSDTDYPSDGGIYKYSIRTEDCAHNLSDLKDKDGNDQIVYITAYPGQLYYDAGVPTKSRGKYNNWLQFNTANSSQYQAKLIGVTLTWAGNNTETNAWLSAVYVYNSQTGVYDRVSSTPTPSGTEVTFSATYLDKATPYGSGLSLPSSTPMQFQWTNQDGTVTTADDMRGSTVTITYDYRLYYHNSYDNGDHESNPLTAGCDAVIYPVARPYGPTFLDVTQNQPLSGTFAETQAGLILIPADKLTDVTSYVKDTTSNLVGMNYVKLFYAFTNRTSTAPPPISTSDDMEAINRWSPTNTKGFIAMTTLVFNPGNDLLQYKTTYSGYTGIGKPGHAIPAFNDQRVWYFMLAKDNNGNVTRWPVPDVQDQSFNYDELPGASKGGGTSVTVGVVSPKSGQGISGTYTVKVAAYSANPGVSIVSISIDGVSSPCALDNSGNWISTWDTTTVPNGSHTITATATAGTMTAVSSPVSFNVTNGDVNVTIASPTDGGTVNNVVNIQASGTSVDGSAITSMQVSIDGGTYADMTQSGPNWTSSWDTTALNNNTQHTIEVLATNANSKTGSKTITVTVNKGVVTVGIINPLNNTLVSGTVTIQATASDTGPGISMVQVSIDGGAYAAMQPGSPWYSDWNTTLLSNASHTITVLATSLSGVTGTLTYTVTVDNSNVTAVIVSPTAGASVGGTVTIQAEAGSTSKNFHISTVQVFIDGVYYKDMTPPGTYYTCSWNTTSLSTGSHNIQVIATDNKGNTGSQSLSVNVNNGNPAVTLVSPADGSTVGGVVTVQATASDVGGPGITSVQVSFDGGTTYSGMSVVGSYWQYSWDTSSLATGTAKTVTVLATNAAGKTATQTNSVTINNGNVSVLIANPANGTTVSGMVTIQATASDVGGPGITSVQVSFNGGVTYQGMSIVGSYWEYSWDTSAMTTGSSHTVKVLATNLSGKTATQTNTVTVNNGDVTVNIVNPADGSTVGGTVTIQATVSTTANGGHFNAGSVQVSVDGGTTYNTMTQSGSYWQWSWNTTSLTDGASYNISVRATDSKNNLGSHTSAATVVNGVVSVNIVNPTGGSTVGGWVRIQATASDTGPGITSVQYIIDDGLYSGNSLYVSGGVYQNWWGSMSVPNGTHKVAVKVTNANGITATQSVNVTVNNGNVSVAITNPMNAATVSGATTIQAFCTTTVGSITGAQISVDGVLIPGATLVGSFWQVGWDTTSAANGSHTITVTATDSNSVTGTQTQTVNVLNSPVSVSINSPWNGAWVSGQPTIQASASTTASAAHISLVQVSIDGGAYQDMTWSGTYWQWSWDTRSLTNGTVHTITVLAEDSKHNTNTSTTVTSVTVDNGTVTVSMVNPGNGWSVSGSAYHIQAWATSSVGGITGAQISVDGVVIPGVTLVGSYWQVDWNTTGLAYNSTHIVTVVATNANNKTGTGSSSVTINNGIVTPSIVSPTSGLTVGNTYTIQASATSTVSSITGMEVSIDGGAFVPMTPPGTYYTNNWITTGVANGTHNITVRATNANQQTGTSQAMNVTVYNVPITISIANPANGTTVSGNAVLIKATAWTRTGTISSVTYSIDGAADQAMPFVSPYYQYSWNTTSLTNGTSHTIKVTDTNSGGDTATSTYTVTADNGTVTTTITSPTDGGTASGVYTIKATATSTGGYSINNYPQVSIDGGAAQNMSWSGSYWQYTNWDTRPLISGTSHYISVTATNSNGKTGASTVTVIPDNGTVSVNISSPLNASTVSGTYRIQASATSTGGFGITSMQVSTDGGTTYTSMQPGSPWYDDWTTTSITNNTMRTIKVLATNANNQTGSATISVTVNNGTVTASIVNPASGSTVSGNAVLIQASESSTGGFGFTNPPQVSFDGGTTYQSMTFGTTYWQYSWDVTALSGSKTITVKATNVNSQSGTATETVTVDNTNVSCSIIKPVSSGKVAGTYTVRVTASTSPVRAVDGVQVSIDGGGWVNAPYNSSTGFYEYAWNTSGLTDNTTHTVDAQAASLTKTGGAAQVTVTKVTPPTITMQKLSYCKSSNGNYTDINNPAAGVKQLVPKDYYVKWYVNVSAAAPATVTSVTLSESSDQITWTGIAMTYDSGTAAYVDTAPRLPNGQVGQNVYYQFTVLDSNGNTVIIPGVAGTYYWIQTQ